MNFTELSTQIDESVPLDFGSIFGKSFDLFKKVWLQGFITLLLTFVTIIPFYILIYIPMIIAGVTDPEMLSNDEVPPELILPMIILMPIVFIGIMTIGLLFNAAFLKICMQKDMGFRVQKTIFISLRRNSFPNQ